MPLRWPLFPTADTAFPRIPRNLIELAPVRPQSLSEDSKPDPARLVAEAVRIVSLAKERDVPLRILGATAIRQHCPNFGYLQDSLGRKIGDIDLASYSKQSSRIAELMQSLGYEEDVTVAAFGGGRLIFRDRNDRSHLDVFLDKLNMSHVISFGNRLQVDYPTLPLADLFLGKMQIFKLNEKDIIDTMMLVREHRVGLSDNETINSSYICELLSKDWGLWRTIIMNIGKVASFLPVYTTLSDPDRSDIKAKLDALLQEIESCPKSVSWKLRARVGEKRKWYNEVEELYR